MAKVRKGGLGKGLDALFVDNTTNESQAVTLRISEIEPNREQPRKQFDEGALSELAASIQEHGVLQPLIVRPMPSGSYQLIAGERRWRAARLAGLQEVPVVIRELDDNQAMAIALIENLQREDLNPVEEASGYQLLMERFALSQEQVAQQVGKSRPAVANALRLLALPEPIQDLLQEGRISAGAGKALLAIQDDEERIQAAKLASEGKLTVRQLEKMGRARRTPKGRSPESPGWGEEHFYKEMELALTQTLGHKVKITVQKNHGTLQIDFYSDQELQQYAQRLAGKS